MQECESGRRPLFGEIVWCKYAHNDPWWPAIIVPTPCIPNHVLASKKEHNQICVFFFGTYNYGWVSQTQIYLYLKEDEHWRTKNEKTKLKNAKNEAEIWIDRFQEITKNIVSNNNTSKPPPYKNIKENINLVTLKKSEYSKCKCRPEDPCSVEKKCYNAVMYIECDPDICPSDMCQNQNFQRGEMFSLQVKITQSKGWGLFAGEEIPAERFVIEYMGEVIKSSEFNERFNHAIESKENNYYFLSLGNQKYIDSTVYGNKARFINHSCDPNVVPNKWIVPMNGKEQNRIGFFALRKILPVCEHLL